jgi:hypothetical protein
LLEKSDFEEDRALRYRLVCQVPTSMQFNITTDNSRNVPADVQGIRNTYGGDIFLITFHTTKNITILCDRNL